VVSFAGVVRDHDDATSLEVALVENMAREDLNAVEEARAVAALVEELGLSREAVGKKVGRSRVAISNLLRILDLPDEVLELLESGRLTEGHGRALLMAPEHADRRRLARAAADQGWSVRVTEDKARASASPKHAAPTGRAAIHPDQAHAAEEIAAALGAALGGGGSHVGVGAMNGKIYVSGGFLANEITNVPGASKVFVAGYVTYSNEEKIRTLDVSQESIEKFGAVSAQVGAEMAEGVRMRAGTMHGIATTGIAGPTGGSAEKPVGTVFVALSSENQPTRCEKFFFPTDRETFKQLVAQRAFDLLRRAL
jgi:PncC family amidohydrolase